MSKKSLNHHELTMAGDYKNIAWLTGWVRNVGADHFYLQRSNHIETALRIEFDPKKFRLPNKFLVDRNFIQVKARVYGHEVIGANAEPIQSASLRLLVVEWPSITSAPHLALSLLDNDDGQDRDEFHPIQNGKKHSLGPNSNVVHIAGFVEDFQLIQGDRPPALTIHISQHEDLKKRIPISIHGPRVMALSKSIQLGMGVLIEGRFSLKTESSEQKIGYIRAEDVCVATKSAIRKVPDYWSEEA